MPINPNIPLMARGFEAPDPLEVMQRITGIRGAQQRQQINQMEIEGAQGAAQVGQRLRAVLSGPRPPTQQEMFSTGIDPKAGLEILKGFSALQEQGVKTEGAERQRAAQFLGSLWAYPDDALRQEAYQEARPALLARGIPEAELPEQYDPSVSDRFLRGAMTPQQQYGIAHPPAPDDYTLGDQRFSGATNQPIAGTPKPAPAPTNLDAAILEAERRGDQAAVERYMGLKERVAKAGRAPAASEPLVPIMGPDGPVLVPRSQAIGKRPASTREQGRPVTSGDAGDLADFDTSLDDLKVLRAAISDAGSTGLIAQAGAAIPWVTQITGWGADAKKKQALIDRVKQVIGKTLEGGVLRKEDEAKYEKILPTIKDPNEVVISKLDGLDAAIAKRKGRRLDALEDAGYDVAKFKGRSAVAAKGKIRARDPQGKLHEAEAGTALPAGWTLDR